MSQANCPKHLEINVSCSVAPSAHVPAPVSALAVTQLPHGHYESIPAKTADWVFSST